MDCIRDLISDMFKSVLSSFFMSFALSKEDPAILTDIVSMIFLAAAPIPPPELKNTRQEVPT